MPDIPSNPSEAGYDLIATPRSLEGGHAFNVGIYIRNDSYIIMTDKPSLQDASGRIIFMIGENYIQHDITNMYGMAIFENAPPNFTLVFTKQAETELSQDDALNISDGASYPAYSFGVYKYTSF